MQMFQFENTNPQITALIRPLLDGRVSSRELTRLDPALDAHPRIDRYVMTSAAPDPAHGALRFADASLRSARRRAFFSWSEDQIRHVGGSVDALGLHGSRHLADFRDFPLLPPERQQAIRNELCRGLSRLEALPDIAFRQSGFIPVRIVPRTPTETSFWVAKQLDRFTLEAERFASTPGLETLHRHLILSYRISDGRKERLLVPLDLFTLLREFASGSKSWMHSLTTSSRISRSSRSVSPKKTNAARTHGIRPMRNASIV